MSDESLVSAADKGAQTETSADALAEMNPEIRELENKKGYLKNEWEQMENKSKHLEKERKRVEGEREHTINERKTLRHPVIMLRELYDLKHFGQTCKMEEVIHSSEAPVICSRTNVHI